MVWKLQEYSQNLGSISYKLKYGLGEELFDEVKNNLNQNLKLDITGKENVIKIENVFDNQNSKLIGNIEINSEEASESNIVIKYRSQDETSNYNNSVIRIFAKKKAKINIVIVNLLNTNSNNFLSSETELEEGAEVNCTVIDFGGKRSISNYYSNLARRYIKKQY